MVPLSAADIVRVWERGSTQDPIARALTVLGAAFPDASSDELASLSLCDRDSRLLAVRRDLFGDALPSFAECPACGAALEFCLDARALADSFAGSGGPDRHEIACGDVRMHARVPDSRDLAALAGVTDVASAARALAERCVTDVRRNGEPEDAENLSNSEIAQVAEHLAALQPGIDTVLAMQCEVCAHAWELFVDVASFLWVEMSARARQLLQQTHLLAWAYGWRESDILAMTDVRRRAYLAMVE